RCVRCCSDDVACRVCIDDANRGRYEFRFSARSAPRGGDGISGRAVCRAARRCAAVARAGCRAAMDWGSYRDRARRELLSGMACTYVRTVHVRVRRHAAPRRGLPVSECLGAGPEASKGPGPRLDSRRRLRRRLGRDRHLRRRTSRFAGNRCRYHQLPRRAIRLSRTPGADAGGTGYRCRQLWSAGYDRSLALGARQYRSVRRRLGARHERRSICRRDRGQRSDRLAACERTVRERDCAVRRGHGHPGYPACRSRAQRPEPCQDGRRDNTRTAASAAAGEDTGRNSDLLRTAAARPRIPLLPVLDGAVLPVDPIDPTARVASHVPLITGFNFDEFMPPRDQTIAEFQQSVRDRYGAHADRLLALYPHATDAEAAQSARALVRDAYMASTYRWATDRTRAGGAPVYAYLFTHPTPVAKPPSFGTFHTSEVPYLFGVLDRSRRPYGDSDEQIAKQLQSYWLNFIRSGDPNGGALPRWNPVTGNAVEVMGLGDDVKPRPAVSSPERFQALMGFVDSGGRLSIR